MKEGLFLAISWTVIALLGYGGYTRLALTAVIVKYSIVSLYAINFYIKRHRKLTTQSA